MCLLVLVSVFTYVCIKVYLRKTIFKCWLVSFFIWLLFHFESLSLSLSLSLIDSKLFSPLYKNLCLSLYLWTLVYASKYEPLYILMSMLSLYLFLFVGLSVIISFVLFNYLSSPFFLSLTLNHHHHLCYVTFQWVRFSHSLFTYLILPLCRSILFQFHPMQCLSS